MAESPTDPTRNDPPAEAAEDEPQPRVTVEDLGPAQKKLNIEIPPELIRQKIDSSYDDLQGEAVVPGFRRGRAPLRLLEKRFGSDIRKEVKSQVLTEALSKAVEDNDLRIVGDAELDPKPDEIELPDQGPLTFTATIEVVPEVELPDLEGLKVTKTVREIGDDAVEVEIERLGEIYGQFQAVEEPAAGGDYLTVDVRIADKQDQTLNEQSAVQILCPGESRKYKGVVGGVLVEDLGKKLEGVKIGQSVTLSATGPQQHEVEAIREAEIDIHITVHRIERLHKLSAAELVQAGGFETEAELRDQLKDSLQQRDEQQQKREMQEQVTEQLLDKIDMTLPEKLSAQQAQRILSRRRMELMYQGVGEQDIEEQLAELRAASADQAQRDLKLMFILEKVAEQYGVQVNEAEVNGQIAAMAAQQGRRPEKMRQEMARSGQMDQLYLQLRESKAIDALLDKAEVEDVAAEAPAKKKTKKKTTKKSSDKSESDTETKSEEKTTKKKNTKKKTTKKKTTKKKADSD